MCGCCWLAAGWIVGDAIMGRYLNPRICNVDLKTFFMWNMGTMGHLTMCAITFIEAYQREKMNAAVILMMSYAVVGEMAFTVLQV